MKDMIPDNDLRELAYKLQHSECLLFLEQIFQVFCDFSDSRQRRHATRQTIRARRRLSAQIFIRPIRNKLTRELVYYTRRRWSTSNIQHRVNTIYLQRPGRESS